MSSYIASWEWFQRGTLVKHNFDPGVYVITDVNLEEETLQVMPVTRLEYGMISPLIPQVIEYYIGSCRPAYSFESGGGQATRREGKVCRHCGKVT